MNQMRPAHGKTDAKARIWPMDGSPATATPAMVAASGKPRMKIDPSAAWRLPRAENCARGVVTGSVSTKTAPRGPMAVTARAHTATVPLSDERA